MQETQMADRKHRKVLGFKELYHEDFDHRYGSARRIRQVYRDLKRQADINSRAKDLLARRAAFLSVKIETLEVQSLTGTKVAESALISSINALVGILKQLGLENLSAVNNPSRLEEWLSRKSRLKAEKAQRAKQRLAKKTNAARRRQLTIAE
jgi:hypothetical protein